MLLDVQFVIKYNTFVSSKGMILLKFDDIEIDEVRFELRRYGEIQHVEPLVFDLIVFLVKNPGRIISRDEVIDELWEGRIVADATISSCIKSARKALGDSGEVQKYIKTKRGRGIQFLPNANTTTETASKDMKGSGSKAIDVSLSMKIKLGIIFALALAVIILFLNQNTTDIAPTPMIGGNEEELLTIAVMPFVDLSAAGNQQYFGFGISEEILNVLTTVAGLDVTSRTTAFSLQDDNLSVPQIAERLGVNYIVEGSVRSSGNRIRITAQLIDAINDVHLWTENYDRELNDIFAIQDEISIAITDALRVELIGDLANEEAPTNNMNAYALYLQGHQYFLNRGTGDVPTSIANLKTAALLLEEAVALDPDYAEAWADLAMVYVVLPVYFTNEYSYEETVIRATEAADRAITLKPDLGQGWAIRGFIYSNSFDFIEAEDALTRATILNPNNETSWLWLNLHYSAVGLHDQAQEAVERAIEIEPTSAIVHNVLGTVMQAKGNRQQAKQLQLKAVDEMGFRLGHIDKALLAIENNNLEHATTEIQKFFFNSDPETKERLSLYIQAYFDDSKHENAIAALDLETGEAAFIGALLLQDGIKMSEYFEGTTVNKVFNFRRIYFENAKPLFNQSEFRNYIVEIGLLDYWKQFEFPKFCRPSGENDFECYEF